MSLTFWKSRQVDPETMSASTPAEGLNLCGKPQGEQDLILERHNDVAETRSEISWLFLKGISGSLLSLNLATQRSDNMYLVMFRCSISLSGWSAGLCSVDASHCVLPPVTTSGNQ